MLPFYDLAFVLRVIYTIDNMRSTFITVLALAAAASAQECVSSFVYHSHEDPDNH